MERVTVYIDGFNLYYGLRAKNWQRYYWLDVRRLSEHLLRPNQLLVGVHYFTTKVFRDPNNPGKFTRTEDVSAGDRIVAGSENSLWILSIQKNVVFNLWINLADLRGKDDRRQHCSPVAW